MVSSQQHKDSKHIWQILQHPQQSGKTLKEFMKGS
jgi:hypothetical protein